MGTDFYRVSEIVEFSQEIKMKYSTLLTFSLFTMIAACDSLEESPNLAGEQTSDSIEFFAEENNYKVSKVEFTDNKALGNDPIFEIKYTFDSDTIKNLTIRCNDNKAKTTFRSPNISNGAPLNLENGDFYCFRMERLVTELAEHTDGYAFPSFGTGSEPNASFDTSNDDLNLKIRILESGVTLFLQNSNTFGTFQSEDQTKIEVTSDLETPSAPEAPLEVNIEEGSKVLAKCYQAVNEDRDSDRFSIDILETDSILFVIEGPDSKKYVVEAIARSTDDASLNGTDILTTEGASEIVRIDKDASISLRDGVISLQWGDPGDNLWIGGHISVDGVNFNQGGVGFNYPFCYGF